MRWDEVLFPYQELVGFRVRDWRDGAIVLEIDGAASQRDGDGLIDRGVQASVLDAATGLACCHCTVPGNIRRIVTLNLTIQYLVPARPGPVTASGRVLQRDGKILLGEGRLEAADGTLLATATARMRYVGGSEDPAGHPA
jgi:uncharacterized protein (TIGR00369 family)